MKGEAWENEVLDVRHESGALSFETRIGERRSTIWLRTDDERPTSDEAVLAASLMPAMRFGGTLQVPTPLSPRLLRDQREYQAIQRAWSLGWSFGIPPLVEVELTAPAEIPSAPATGRVAAFFSGGVDSWSTVLDNPDLTDLIFVRGADLDLTAPNQAPLLDLSEGRLRGAASELGLDFHVVETNLREMSNQLLPNEAFLGCGLVMAAHFLGPRFDRVLLPNAYDYEVEEPYGISRQVSRLWSTERLEIAEDGGRHRRVERIARIARNPIVQRTLRVCFENRDGAYNCCRCPKCVQTMVNLEALGVLGEFETFPEELDLEIAATIPTKNIAALTRSEDLLDAVREAGRADLEPPIEAMVAQARRECLVSPSFRRRAQPATPPLDGHTETEAEEQLAAIFASRSWRLTAPLRRLRRRA